MGGVGAWVRYGEPITPEQLDFAARHYRTAILQPWELDAAAELKRRRPDMVVLAYKCLSSARDYEPGPIFSSGVSYAEATAHGWLARRLDGSPIEWNTYPGHWQLTPWDAEYRSFWAKAVVGEFQDSPFDGVMADNDVFDDYYGLDLPIRELDEIADLRVALTALVHEAGSALRAVGKRLVPNIAESRREPGRWAEHSAYGGGFEEVWLGYAPDRLFDPITTEAQLGQVAGSELSIMRVPTDGDDAHPNFQYGLAAFWVFAAGEASFTATGHDDYSRLQHIPQLDWELGAPVGDPVEDRHVWSREREHGWAAVNLNADRRKRRRIRVPPGMVDLHGQPVKRSLTLPAQRGIVLRRA